MDIVAKGNPLALEELGRQMYGLVETLYPICRSITGNGVRKTLSLLQNQIPIEMHEVPTGTQVFDWTVPKEWNIRDAYIKNDKGERVIDFKKSNLHVVSYSTPVRTTMRLDELRNYLFSLPEKPDWIPYRTSYYNESWGFCLSHKQLLSLEEGEYEVVIDSTLENGSLTYGEYLVPGSTTEEVLIYTHVCHPSLCNDNLSGIALATYLADWLSSQSLRYSYRFVFAPGTIGSIVWLSLNEARLDRIKHGLVVALVGDGGKLTYKKSRRGDSELDRVVMHSLKHSGADFEVLDFSPWGYDERQFCSPGINLPVGRLTRTPHGAYPEYHTSSDNLDLVRPEFLTKSFSAYLSIINALEKNAYYINLSPKCEPQLGRRGLYRKVGVPQGIGSREYALLWVLNFSDGAHSLLDIAERSGLNFAVIEDAAGDLQRCGLLERA
ncbi:MAG: DUF4910 domain-containing protein [Burkholderiales bacterium]